MPWLPDIAATQDMAPAGPAAIGVVERLRRLARHRYLLLTHGMTLGVRAVVLDLRDGVFLVRHTYVRGWYMPGGGVEVGETARQALARELPEEGNIVLAAEPALLGLYLDMKAVRHDHVAVFVARAFRQTVPKRPDREIAESGFFDLTALPEGTTASTQARIAEAIHSAPLSAHW